jgi:5'-3' exonuclease
MGIKGMITFLNSLPVDSGVITKVHLSAFKGKTIAVDFTNLLHRFIYRDSTEKSYLLEFINLIHKFQRYSISLVFVLDGKPIVEKQYVIEHRKAYRERLIKKIDELNESSDSSDDQSNAIRQMSKKTNKIKTMHIQECKKLFEILGIPYIHINDMEADTIFKFLLDNNLAHACFSADTDLIAYGCHTVLKDLDFRNDIVQVVDYTRLLNLLSITHEQFLYTCILSGTDYNNSLKRSKFDINLELVRQYGTIDSIINNLEVINSSQPEEYKKSLPLRFDWKTTFELFCGEITLEVQRWILEYLAFHNACQSTNLSNSKVQQYLNTKIKPVDTGTKYSRKFAETIRYRYNLELKV